VEEVANFQSIDSINVQKGLETVKQFIAESTIMIVQSHAINRVENKIISKHFHSFMHCCFEAKLLKFIDN
jgi:hypothetical protein